MLLLGAVSGARADYPSEVSSLGPINYWRLNEAGPVPAPILATNQGTLGAIGNGNYVNGTRGTPGALAGETSTCATFAGDNSRVTVPYDAASMGTTSFTIEGWVRPAVSPPPAGQSSLAAVLSCGHLASPRTGWLIYQAASGWNLRGYNGVDANAAINITGGPTPVAGTWYHIAATFDGSIARVFVNGVETAVSGSIGNYAANTDGVLSIGTRSDVAFPYNGDVDEVAYYPAALSAATIASHYQTGTSPSPSKSYATLIGESSPAVYLPLNEQPYVALLAQNTGSRGSAANGSYNPNATIGDGPLPPAQAGLDAGNKAPSFDGLTGSINCGTNASLGGATDFTILAWVKTTATARGTIIQQRDVDTAVAGYNGEYKISANDDGTVQFMLYKDGYQFDFASTGVVNDGNWHQVAAIRKGLEGQIYIDGTLSGSATGTELKELVQGIRTFIGRDMRDFIDPFNGSIDEVAVFDKALTAGTITSLYATAMGQNLAPAMVSDPPVLTPATTIYATTSFTITPDISGSLPMTFEWRKNGTVVGTSRDYTKSNVSLADSGNYDVIAQNAFGSVTSSIVVVTINPAEPAQVTTGPVARGAYLGGGATFSVQASGTAPLTYQWKKGGVDIVGQTSATLHLSNISAADVATYSVGVSNVAGGVVSSGAALTIRTPAAGSYEAAVAADSPIAYWRLGEKSGSTALDYAGGFDGTYTNVNLGQAGFSASDSDTAGGFEKALLSVVGVPVLDNFNYTGATPAFTLEAWVNFADFPGVQRVFSKGGPGFHGIGFGAQDANTLRFTTYGVQDFNQALPTALQAGTWYHLVGVSSGGTMSFYVNGQLVGAITYTGACLAADGNPPFAVGRNGLGSDEAVNGTIDEAAVYNKALTAQQVFAHYAQGRFGNNTKPAIVRQPASQSVVEGSSVTLNVAAEGSIPLSYQWAKGGTAIPGATSAQLVISGAGYGDAGNYSVTVTNPAGSTTSVDAKLTVLPPPSYANLTNGLVLHLRFDGDFQDASGKGNHGSPVGPPPFAAGKIGQCAHIATSPGNNYVTVADNSGELGFDETASFTVAFWIKYTARFNDVPIICNAINSTYQLGWTFTDEGGKIEYSLVSTANSGTYVADPVSGSPQIDNGAWHHIVGVVDREQKLATVYVDGASAGSWSIDGLGTLVTDNLITIGQDPTGAYGSATFDLDDLGIWRRALSSYDALSIYNAGQASQSFDVYGPVKMQIVRSATGTIVAWQAGTLESNDDLSNPSGWAPVAGANAPSFTIPTGGTQKFYRVRL